MRISVSQFGPCIVAVFPLKCYEVAPTSPFDFEQRDILASLSYFSLKCFIYYGNTGSGFRRYFQTAEILVAYGVAKHVRRILYVDWHQLLAEMVVAYIQYLTNVFQGLRRWSCKFAWNRLDFTANLNTVLSRFTGWHVNRYTLKRKQGN